MSEKKQEITSPTSERFTNAVLTEFTQNAGEIMAWGPHQKMLAQHLYIKIDTQLADLEAKRIKDGVKKDPIVWQNINMKKLAIDTIRRIELGLDALAPNHIHPIPYFNGKLKKYDLDLRIGYEGKMFYRREIAIDPPKDVRIELVYSTDKFKPIKKSDGVQIEVYEFEITKAFDRGAVVGGFGYIIYDDQTKNKLILVTKKDFEKSENKGNATFWKGHPDNMKYKTIVHRVADKLGIDPKKMNAAVADAESQDEKDFEREIDENANKTVIDIDGEQVDTESGEVMEEAQTTETATVKTEDVETTKINKPGPGF